MTTYMGLSDTDAVLWFENLCLVQLNRNPTETTKQLEAFRETEQGLTVAIHILKTSNTTYDASPNKFILQFHALSIAHYTLLLRWERFVSEDKLQWKSFLFEYLQQIISSSTTPHYLIQKVIQVYVSIWKKDWLSLNAQEKDSFFRPFLVGLNPTNQYHLQKSSMIFILMTIDEFQRKTAFDLSIFYHDMIMIKRDFQEHYLPRIFFLVMSQLSQLFGYLVDISAVADAGELLIISLKAINEIIQWDFHENISKFTDTQTERQVCIGKLPSDYLALVEPSFIGRVLDILHKLVNVRSNNDLVSNKSNMFEELLQELRNLSLALSLLHPDMFPNDSCKSNFVVEIVKGSLFIGNLFLKRSTLQLLTVEANDYTEGGTRSAALTFVLQIFRNVISNHSLMQLIPISHSNPLLAGVLADIFVFIFLSLEGVCQEVSILTNDVNIRLLRSNFKDVSMEMNLLSTWRIDVLISILDLLEVVANAFYEFSSEKNLIALLHTLTIDNASSLTTLLADKIQVDLYRSKLDVFSLMTAYLAPIIYPTLCECVATIFVNDSLSCAEDEENEEDADIGGHIIQSLLSGCGILGRFNIGYALNNLSRMVEGSVKDMRDLDAIMSVNGSTQSEIFQLKEIYCLEKTRVTLLFACHLLADDFASELSDSETRMEAQVTSIMKTGKDAPTINFWILYGFESSVHEASCLNSFQFLNECIQRFNALLQYQLEILSRSQGSSGIMASPLLLQTTLNFFGSFLEKFMDPNTELYSTETLSAITFLSSDRLRGNTKFSILSAEHELIVLSCIKFSLGDVFNTFLETILATLFCLLDRLPYESGAIRASCECIVTATKSVNPLRSIFISRHQSLQSILVKYFTTSSQEQMMGANISFDAFASLTESIVVALLGGHSTDVFTQLCHHLFHTLNMVQNSVLSSQYDVRIRRQIVAAFTGLSRSPECETSVLFDLFDAFWVWISSVLLVGNKPTLCLGIFVKESDELLTSLGYLLRDYAEFQLPRLNDQSASKLYNAFVCLMTLYSSRLKKVTVAINKNSIEDHQLFINDSCSLLFEVMNHLSTKDLVCLDVSNVSTHTIHEVMNMKDVSDALLYGFKTLLPVLTEEMVTSYPVIAERFVSFTVFMMGSYVDTVSKWFSTLPNALHIFQHFVNLLGVGCFVPDGSTARMALQALQMFTSYQAKCFQQGKASLPREFLESLSTLFVIFFNASLQPPSREVKITVDRMDAYANTFFVMLVLDTALFHKLVQNLIGGQVLSVKPLLTQCFHALCTDRSVSMTNLDKKNRQLFVQNFREFINQVRSLPVRI